MTYAGDLNPHQAWDFLAEHPEATLVDVRTPEEWSFVGVPDTTSLGSEPQFIPWVFPGGVTNANFLGQLDEAGLKPGDGRPVLFLCRSGQRSVAAANAATAAGFGPAYNITEGFEGGLSPEGHRGTQGWKAAGLAWKQS